MPRVNRAGADVFEHQAEATLNQANPVSGTKYTVLDTTKNVRALGMSGEVTWSVDTTSLEIHLTIDGNAYAPSVDPTSGTIYVVYLDESHATAVFLLSSSAQSPNRAFLLECRSLKVEAESTGGTADPLEANVIYSVIP